MNSDSFACYFLKIGKTAVSCVNESCKIFCLHKLLKNRKKYLPVHYSVTPLREYEQYGCSENKYISRLSCLRNNIFSILNISFFKIKLLIRFFAPPLQTLYTLQEGAPPSLRILALRYLWWLRVESANDIAKMLTVICESGSFRLTFVAWSIIVLSRVILFIIWHVL